MKKIGSFIGMCLCIVGAVGGIGGALAHGDYPFAIGIAALSYTAYPQFKKYINTLMF